MLRVLLIVILCTVSGWMQSARANGLSQECYNVISGGAKKRFKNSAEEISFTALYNNCWAENAMSYAGPVFRSYLGRSLEILANPANVDSQIFSKNTCVKDFGLCWFEGQNAQNDVSVEEAARREVPKVLFANSIPQRDGSTVVEYVLCTNDDPTKPKEYSKVCKRGKNLTMTEYGRGDFTGDHAEDVIVNIKFGTNNDERRWCFMAIFTRKDAQMLKVYAISYLGQCE